MFNTQIIAKTLSIVCAIYLSIPFINIFAKAYTDSTYKPLGSDDLWNVDRSKDESFYLYNYLSEEGLIADGVSYGDFDYICVLTEQLCTMTDHVTPDVALAMIAIESNFDTNAKTGSARGLMQLIPIYHSTRMNQFVESTHQIDLDDFFVPRLNIMTGLDYLDYILEETKDDLPYALMWYNQGPVSASKDYLDNLRVSSYAKRVIGLAKDIKTFLREEDMDVCNTG